MQRAGNAAAGKDTRNRIENNLAITCESLYEVACEQLKSFESYVPGEPIPRGWQIKKTEYNNDANKRNIHCFTKTDEAEGHYYEVLIDQRYHVNTFKLHSSNPDDRRNGFVGTDHAAVVKIFQHGSYDYVKVDDFIDRSGAIFESGIKIIDEMANVSLADKSKKIETLARYRQVVAAQLLVDCDFDGKSVLESVAKKKFETSFMSAKIIQRHAVLDIAITIAELRGNKINNETIENIINEIQRKEMQMDIERGRPVILKVGSDDAGIKMISAQFPLGQTTLPSSDRSGKHQVKLSNHVRDFTGIVDKNNEIKLEFCVDGHSSYPPIDEKNPAIRMQLAYLAAKEKIEQMARDAIKAGVKEEPLKISFSAMILLTPFIFVKTEKKARKKESENMQLEVSHYALELLRNTNPLTVNVDGKSVLVELDLSYMNLSANMKKVKLKATETPLQKAINARGMQELTDRMSACVNEVSDHDIRSKMQTYYQMLHKKGEEDFLQDRMVLIRQRQKQVHIDVSAKVNHLESLLAKLQENNDNISLEQNGRKKELLLALSAQTIADMDEAQKFIVQKQQSLNLLYEDLGRVTSERYLVSLDGGTTMRERNLVLQEDIKAKISTLLKWAEGDNLPQKISKVKDTQEYQSLITQLRFLRAQEYYHTRDDAHGNSYQFQANYLLANYSLGRAIEAFCKSGEDRTGLLRTSLMADDKFLNTYGYPPDIRDKSDQEKYNKIFAASYELSASLDGTGANVRGARGKQVSAKYVTPDYDEKTNPGFNVSAGEEVAGMAKGVFKETLKETLRHKLKKIQKSDALNQVEEDISRESGIIQARNRSAPVVTPRSPRQSPPGAALFHPPLTKPATQPAGTQEGSRKDDDKKNVDTKGKLIH